MEQRAGVTVEGVTQTVTVGDGSGKYGNCLQAAVATFLSTDLENVPDFVNENGVWWDCLFYGYLVKCGYLVRTVGLTGKPIPPERSLVFGDSPRGGGIKHLLSPKQARSYGTATRPELVSPQSRAHGYLNASTRSEPSSEPGR